MDLELFTREALRNFSWNFLLKYIYNSWTIVFSINKRKVILNSDVNSLQKYDSTPPSLTNTEINTLFPFNFFLIHLNITIY